MSQTNSSPINVKNGSGTFYIVSKTNPGTDGWKEETVRNPQTDEQITRFRKDISVVGTVQWVGLRESPFKGVGLTLNMLVKNEEEGVTYSLEFPMLSQKGVKSVDDYFRSVIGSLQNVKKGDKVTMFLNSKNKDKNDRLYKNVIILDESGSIIKSNYSFSDVPKWDSTKTVDFTGKETVTYDATPTNKFFYDIATEVVAKFEKAEAPTSEQGNKAEPTPEQPKDNFPAPGVNVEIPEDDLPF